MHSFDALVLLTSTNLETLNLSKYIYNIQTFSLAMTIVNRVSDPMGPRTQGGPRTRIILPIKYIVWLKYSRILYFI